MFREKTRRCRQEENCNSRDVKRGEKRQALKMCLGTDASNSGDTAKLKKTGIRNGRDMWLHGQCVIKNDAKTSDLVRKGNVGALKL